MTEDAIVCDTGPLIALSLIDHLHVLRNLYPRVVTPRAVLDELAGGGPERPGTAALNAEWLEVVEGLKADPLLATELGPGESAVIAVAYQMSSSLVLLDERKARRIATRVYGLRVRGSAGILVAAKRKGLVDEVRPLLESMTALGYYLSRRVVERASAEAGES